MRIIKGVHTGRHVTLAMFCNDWIIVKELPDEALSPLMVRVDSAAELSLFSNDSNPGAFWNLYEPQADGTFAAKGRVKV